MTGGRARFLSRNGKDWTERFPGIGRAASGIPVENAILDGEVVVIDQQGRTDFQALQNIVRGGKGSLSYMVFDIPFRGGYDLTDSPLIERKELLRNLLSLGDGFQIRFSEHISGEGDTVFVKARGLGFEGIVSTSELPKATS